MSALAPIREIFEESADQGEFEKARKSVEQILMKSFHQSPGTSGLQWLSRNPELLKEVAGKWIILDGSSIVASDAELANAVKEARRSGVACPFALYIPSDPDSDLLGIANQPDI